MLSDFYNAAIDTITYPFQRRRIPDKKENSLTNNTSQNASALSDIKEKSEINTNTSEPVFDLDPKEKNEIIVLRQDNLKLRKEKQKQQEIIEQLLKNNKQLRDLLSTYEVPIPPEDGDGDIFDPRKFSEIDLTPTQPSFTPLRNAITTSASAPAASDTIKSPPENRKKVSDPT